MSVETRFGNGAIKRNSILKTVGIAVFAALFCVGCGDKDEDKYIITFMANGGTVTPERATTDADGRLMSFPTPERDGYTFVGWYSSTDYNFQITANRSFDGNTTLYARWTPTIYVINYGLNGGYTNYLNNLVTTYTIESATFTLAKPDKTGYIFLGWTGTNGELPQTSVTIAKGSTGDRDYHANWEPEPEP